MRLDNGSIGFFWTHQVPGKGDIFSEISKCYQKYEWIDKYSSDDYIALFNTNSAHQVLEQGIKDKLFNGTRDIIEKHGNEILKPQFVVLYLARKK
jgi:hypothetical protein